MILDNENENLKVYEWISKYTEEGKLDMVTGYFTIGALAYLSKAVNNNIEQFRLVLGDIVNIDIEENRPLDLLNENITIEAALKPMRFTCKQTRHQMPTLVSHTQLVPVFRDRQAAQASRTKPKLVNKCV